jgi:hypothetical protein
VAIRKDRNAKAELNRRRQACEVLTGTGVRVAKNSGARVCDPQQWLANNSCFPKLARLIDCASVNRTNLLLEWSHPASGNK